MIGTGLKGYVNENKFLWELNDRKIKEFEDQAYCKM